MLYATLRVATLRIAHAHAHTPTTHITSAPYHTNAKRSDQHISSAQPQQADHTRTDPYRKGKSFFHNHESSGGPGQTKLISVGALRFRNVCGTRYFSICNDFFFTQPVASLFVIQFFLHYFFLTERVTLGSYI